MWLGIKSTRTAALLIVVLIGHFQATPWMCALLREDNMIWTLVAATGSKGTS